METPERSRLSTASDAYIRHVAHDLRASLNTVVGWGELVKAGQLSPEDTARAGATIVRHARQLSQRLIDALDAWRADAGLLEFDARQGPIAPAVQAAVEQSRLAFDSRQVTCEVDIRTGAAGRFDPARLVQALTLLLSDAAANTAPGDVVRLQAADEHGRIVIAVVGGGRMPGAHAFESDPADTRPDPSARSYNFGLPLASTLVSRQGGTLQAVPVDGACVKFVIELPAEAGGTARDAEPVEVKGRRAGPGG